MKFPGDTQHLVVLLMLPHNNNMPFCALNYTLLRSLSLRSLVTLASCSVHGGPHQES